jgi:hypothetical protein
MTRRLLIAFFLCQHLGAYAQSEKIDIKNFKVMVIPYLESEEKIGSKLKQNPNLRLAIANLQDVLLSKSLKVIDFDAKYKKYEQDKALKDPNSDIKALFVEYASPDIFVEIEINHVECGDGTRKVRVRLKTYITATSDLIADKVVDSNCFVREADVLSLVKNAFNKSLDSFVESLQQSLSEISETGYQPLQLHITITDNSGYDFNSVVAAPQGSSVEYPMPLSNAISMWMYKNPTEIKTFSSPSNSPQLLIFEEIKIQLFDRNGRVYPQNLFVLNFWSFLNSLNLGENTLKKIKSSHSTVNRTVYINLN